jgi:hypothetical protein
MDINHEVARATAATDAFVAVLAMETLEGWSKRFAEISKLLRAGDLGAALQSFESYFYTGPGSLSDVYAKDQGAFDKAWSECSTNLRSLKRNLTLNSTGTPSGARQ